MLRWFRAWRRPAAALVLAAFAALGGVSSAGHGSGCHDEPCAAVVPHDASAHAIHAASSAPAQDLHCVLCHCTRSPRHSTEPLDHVAPAAAGTTRLHAETVGAVASVELSQHPLRSPPAVSAHVI